MKTSNEALSSKDSGINRVVGFEEGIEGDLLDFFRRQFEANVGGKLEVEHPLELRPLILRINEKMPEFLERYGVRALAIAQENVHLIDRSQLSSEELQKFEEMYKDTNGFYSPSRQGVAVFREYKEGSKLPFMQTLVHEFMHLQGFYSYQASSSESPYLKLEKVDSDTSISMDMRRSGFSVGTSDGEKMLFDEINEALITELAIRFEKEYFGLWPELAEEIKERDDYIEMVAKRDRVSLERVKEVIGSIIKEELGGPILKWRSHAYNRARAKLIPLINEIFGKNRDKFSSSEEVFTIFATALMTGRLLPIARLIDGTYGPGAFRELGERTKKVEKP